MNRILLISLLIFFAKLAQGNDTLKVRSHDRVHMNWYGNYDRVAQFPTAGKTYQSVKMHYTLGCPDKGCSEWDYTVQVFLRRRTNTYDSTQKFSPNFKVNNSSPDTFQYNTDTSFSYFFNAALPGIDSIANLPVMLYLFSDSLNPLSATDSMLVWDAKGFRPEFDQNGIPVDSFPKPFSNVVYKKNWYYFERFEVIQNLELGRLITPYAADKTKNWEFTYSFDITDFAFLLSDSVTIRSHYSGYQDGFTATIDFELIEGQPALKVLDIIPLWEGGFPYGYTKGIEEYLVPRKVNINKLDSQKLKLRIIQTGHGFGGNENCAEFCQKEHFVKVNGVQRYKSLIWKSDCGKNALFPQPGTWLYDRANWCPGESVNPLDYWLEDFLVDGENTIDLDMQPFVNVNNNNSSYIISGFLVLYEKDQKLAPDVSLEEIIAPNNRNNFVRFNPTCGYPRVRVRNNSTQTVSLIRFEYGVQGGSPGQYTWSGSLLPFESKEIDLEYFDWTGASSGVFTASVIGVNGLQDRTSGNNTKQSNFALTPVFPNEFQIWFRSNSKGNESTLSVHQLDGRVIWSRANFGSNESTRDTIRLVAGCYYLKLADAGRNGIKFWANNDGTGSLSIRQMAGSVIQVIDGDFGTEVVRFFTVGHPLVNHKTEPTPWNVYPNPTAGNLHLEFDATGVGQFRLIDAMGKEVAVKSVNGMGLTKLEWNIAGLNSGFYFLEYSDNLGRSSKKIIIE